MAAGARPAGNAFHDANASTLQLMHLIGIIGEQANGANAERFERFGGKLVIAGVVREAEAPIGFHRVEARILQFVRLEFVDQADSAAFLRQIQAARQRAPWRFCAARIPIARGNRNARK